MTIYCKLRVMLARVNVERAQQGKPTLSLRKLADESGVSLSVLAALNTGRSHRIDYNTIDQLLTYFSRYFNVSTNDLLTWEYAAPAEGSTQVGQADFSRQQASRV
jgi:DNA-binding Xre family transcriptional regulator